jgi:cardiolipin synthase
MSWVFVLKVAVAIAIPLLDIITIGLAIVRTRGVTATLAWMFGIIALPGVGALAYLTLASPGIKRQTRRLRLSRAAVRRGLSDRLVPKDSEEELLPHPRSVFHLASFLTGLLPSGGNRVEFLGESARAFDRIEEALRAATRQIWAEYYIIGSDETSHRFLDLLAEKARQGVEVRLIYDGVGSFHIDAHRLERIRQAGGKAEVFLPVNPLRRRWAVHLRNHRKLIVVDGVIGFTGGMNIGDEYSGRLRKRGTRPFRDAHLRLEGPAVHDLALTFAEDWHFTTEEHLTPPARPAPVEGQKALVGVVPSGPDQEFNANGLMYFSAINAAVERCWLTSPYFVPDDSTMRALIAAALRGVDVRILVPRHSDVVLIGPAARSYYPPLVNAGVRVYEYEASVLHAKTMVVDGAWGVVGSANLDIRSFQLNFEVGALVHDRAFALRLEDRYIIDLGHAREITREDIARRSLALRFGYGVARLLSPLL